MDTHKDQEKTKIVPGVDAILAEQEAKGEHDVPDGQIPTVENSLLVRLPEDLAKNGEPADGYQGRAEDTTRDDLWQSAEEFPGASTKDEAQADELSGPPQAASLDENSSADDYAADTSKQTSQGGLLEGQVPRVAEAYEVVRITRIQHFLGLRDYLAETISPNPILAQINDDDVLHCIEAWDMVEDALNRKQELIFSLVKSVRLPAGADLLTELTILKTAVRMGSQGGPVQYAEGVANMTHLYSKLRASTVNPLIYGRGGARTKGEKGNTRAENIRWVIETRLGRDRDTVTAYLNYGRYLTEEALSELVMGGATKRVFEAFQKPKSELIIKLQGLDATPDEITALTSELVISLFKKAYLANDRKLEQAGIKQVVGEFYELHFPNERDVTPTPVSGAPVEGQIDTTRQTIAQTGDAGEPGETDQASTSAEEDGGSKGVEKTGRTPGQVLSAASQFDEEKKKELIELLSDLTSEAVAITDNAGREALEVKMLAHALRRCSQFSSDTALNKIIEELRAENRG